MNFTAVSPKCCSPCKSNRLRHDVFNRVIAVLNTGKHVFDFISAEVFKTLEQIVLVVASHEIHLLCPLQYILADIMACAAGFPSLWCPCCKAKICKPQKIIDFHTQKATGRTVRRLFVFPEPVPALIGFSVHQKPINTSCKCNKCCRM